MKNLLQKNTLSNQATNTLAQPSQNMGSLFVIFLLASVFISSFLFIDSQYLSMIAIIGIISIIFIKPSVGLYVLIPLFFLESNIFSLYYFDAYIQMYQIITFVIVIRLFLDIFLLRIRTLNKTILDAPLILYGLANVISIFYAEDKNQSIKTSILIFSLIGVYFILINFKWTKETFLRIIVVFLFFGTLETLIGMYQFLSYALNSYFAIRLPTFPQIHSDILPFGRPYGTLVEPDWFGFATALFFFFTFTLVLSRTVVKNKTTLAILMFLFLVANILSVTRGAWIGIILGFGMLVHFHRKYLTKLSRSLLRYKFFGITVFFLMLLSIISFSFIPQVHGVIKERSTSIFNSQVLSQEPRTMIINDALRNFVEKPIIGNGAGSYRIIGITPYVQERDRERFDVAAFIPNILVTILHDTGIIGFIIFSILMYRFYSIFRNGITDQQGDIKLKTLLLALFSSTIVIFISFQVSTGFWFGLTWFMIGLTVICSQLITKKKEHLP